jgi:hypothetical protein
MLDKIERSDRAPNPNEKPESCYCSALPKGSGLCLPCYTRCWPAGVRKESDLVLVCDCQRLPNNRDSGVHALVQNRKLRVVNR